MFCRHRSIAVAGCAAMSVPMSFSSETLRGRSLESAATELESATGASRLANTSAYWFETPSMPTASNCSPARTSPTFARSRPSVASM